MQPARWGATVCFHPFSLEKVKRLDRPSFGAMTMPLQEQVHIIRCRASLSPDILIRIIEGCFYDRPYGMLRERAMKSSDVPETKDGVPPNTRSLMPSEPKADTLCPLWINRMESRREDSDGESLPVISGDRFFNLAPAQFRHT